MSRTRFCMYRISAEMNWTNGALMALVVVNSSWGIPPHCQKVSRVLNVVISCTFETFMFCYWFSPSAPQKASRPSRWHLNLEQSIRIFGGLMCCVHVTRGTKVGLWSMWNSAYYRPEQKFRRGYTRAPNLKVRLHTTTVSVVGGCCLLSLALFSRDKEG